MNTPTVAVLDRVPEGWDTLLSADPSATAAHRPVLWEAFTAALPGCSWRVITVHDEGRLVGGAPVMATQRGPWRELHALPWMLPAAPLAVPGAHARTDAAVAQAFTGLAREWRVWGGTWSLYRPEGPPIDEASFAVVPGRVRTVETAVLPLHAGLEARRATMARKQRQALDQALARSFAFAEEPAALDEAYALHLTQSRGWGHHRPLPIGLSRRLLTARDAQGPVARLFTLRSSAGLASATLALDGEHETFLWWAGTHANARRSGAFLRLVWEIARWAEAHGRRRVNLGASLGLPWVASFKQSLGVEGVTHPVRVLDAGFAPAPIRWWAALRAARMLESA